MNTSHFVTPTISLFKEVMGECNKDPLYEAGLETIFHAIFAAKKYNSKVSLAKLTEDIRDMSLKHWAVTYMNPVHNQSDYAITIEDLNNIEVINKLPAKTRENVIADINTFLSILRREVA